MQDDTRQLLDDILAEWHWWCRAYRYAAGVGRQPMFAEALSSRNHETQYEIAENQIESGRMEAVDFHVNELRPEYRTALQINARNIVTGRSVWKSARLPEAIEERAVLLADARNALMRRLIGAGVI